MRLHKHNALVQDMELQSRDTVKDRISTLPDVLLADILSLLPTKDAVATSLLSTRWRYVYTWIKRLEFYHPPESGTFQKFKIYVDNVLQNCQSENISSFRLHFNKAPEGYWRWKPDPNSFAPLDPKRCNAWFCYPLTRGVSELHICARVQKPGKLPSAIFGCQSLLVLKIDVNLELDLQHPVCLPHLKEFHISIPSFPNDDSVNRLLASCPSLEHLALKGYWDAQNPVHISAPFLRKLCLILPDSRLRMRSRVVLNIPNLEYLEYEDSFALHYSIGHMNVLKEAYVNTSFSELICPVVQISSLISPLSNVERLNLGVGCLEALQACESKPMLPIFSRLKHLLLGCNYFLQWNKFLLDLLNSTPFIETLTFLGGIMYSSPENDDCYDAYSVRDIHSWSNCQIIPSCLGFHLKRIEIRNYISDIWELEVVKYFLRSSSALEELIIKCKKSITMEKKISFGSTLQQLPRSSMVCSIKVL